MYGQGNFSQFGQGPHTSMPPTHQRLPPPPPPPFQQGPPAPRPTIVQQGPPSVPPHAGQPAPPAYLQVHGPVHQGPPVPIPPGGMLNSGQSYLNLPPPRQMHGSTPMVHSYSTAQQNFQWTQNVHHIQPPAPPPLGPPATGPEMPHPPPAHRGLPPPPSQGPVLYRGLVHPPPSGGVQGLQHSLPPPPPPPPPPLTSSFFIPAPFGSFMQSAPQDSHMPSMGLQPPPPPPSSPPPGPPPLPPSSPPPTSPPPSFGASSSAPLLTDVELPRQSESGLSSNNHSGFVVMDSDSVDRLLASHQISDDASRHGDLSNHKGGTDCEVRSLVEHGLQSAGNLKLDIPPPPHKPTEEKIVRKIEILCQYIAKNGPEFEDKIRQKEFGNPEFEFLLGGEPGSEAASAHEYFVWMKKKCSLGCKLHEEQQHGDSPLSPPRNDYSLQSDCLMDACVSSSHADSDMDMEDDITQPDQEQHIYKSFETQNHESDLISNEADTNEQLHAPQNTSEHSPAKYAVSGNLFCSGSSGSVDHGEGPNLYLDHDLSTSGVSLTMVDSSVMDPVEASEFPIDSNVEKSSLCPHEDLIHSNSSAPVVSSVNGPGQLIKGTSPFRLLQDYASDDSSENEDEPCLEDVHPATVSASVKAGAASLDGEMGSDFQTDPGSKGLSVSEKEFRPLLESVGTFSLDVPAKSLESSIELEGVVRKTDPTSIATGKADQLVDNSHGNQESVDSDISHKAFQQKNVLGGGDVNATPESGKSQKEEAKEDVKCMSAQLKVDEFGRLVREGASDSDSDDLHYNKKRGKRGRSWSRSPSPHDRTRRSSWRRKEKRSRSRSWSPKRRRSRSKSPSLRRAGEFGGDKTRRDKGQLPDCFDFRRGKCYRGALCRYLHHDAEKSDGSRRYKSKLQYEEVAPSSKSSGKSVNEHDEVESQEMQLYQDLPKSSFGTPKDENIYQKVVVVAGRNAEQIVISDQDGKSLVTAVAESERAREVSNLVQETQDIKEELVETTIHLAENESSLEAGKNVILVDSFSAAPVIDADAGKLPTDTSHDISYSLENSGIQQSQANLSDPVLQNADYQPQQVDKLSASNSSPMQTSATIQNQLPVSEPHSNQISSMQLYSGTGSMSKPNSSENISSQSVTARESSPHIPRHPSQLPPPPPPPPVSLGTYPPFPPQLPSDFNIMQPTVNYPSHTASVANYSSYQAPFLYQHSHFSAPPNSSWNSLPPPPPLPPPHPPFVNDLSVNAATASHGVPSLQFQQHQLPPRNDFPSQTFVRPYPAELPTHSQVSEFQHRAYPPMHEPDRPLSHMEDLRPSTLPMINPMTQQFGGPSLVGEDRFTRLPIQGLISSNSFAQGNMQPQPLPFSRESPLRRMQSFSGDNLPPGELRAPQSQPSYGLQRPASDSVSTQLGESGMMNSTLSRYSSDFLDRNQPSRMSEFGGSRISNYYNPYASTFDQPLSSKFGSNIFNQEKDTPYSNKYGSPFSLSQVPIDGQGVGNLGSRNTTSSTNSARVVERILPRCSDDQYDPLFDSIEPSSNSFRKSDHGQKREATDDSDSMLKRSGSNKPQDVEENNKQKEAGPVAVTTSLDNEEYGETADAEVGAVENGSPSDPIDEAITGAGDVEIDQVKTPGKSKKSKDSRSMKLFKVALADFVKEVLKPSWRQGNMSKEAFKTIVKKTVDKVSGAMKNHQIPKSQAKITQYIDSSQRKLTKLVMGNLRPKESVSTMIGGRAQPYKQWRPTTLVTSLMRFFC